MAAAYTTLFCYIIFAAAHYIFMNRICRDKLDGVVPYSSKRIIYISMGFMAVCFGLLCSYNYFILRYVIIGMLLLLMWMKRKYLQREVATLVSIRKEGKVG